MVGDAETTFPHPAEWRLKGIDKPLDKVTVRDLTAAFTRQRVGAPTCKRKWEAELGQLDWRGIGQRYTAGLMTPKDFGPHYKLILHRTMRTRGESWQRVPCCMCGAPHQRIIHWGACPGLRPVFDKLREVDGGERWDDPRLNLHGIGLGSNTNIAPDGQERKESSLTKVKTGPTMIHMITWKFILIALTKKSIEGAPVNTGEIIKAAQNRVQKRLDRLSVRLHSKKIKAEARDAKANFDTERKWTDGIGEIDEDGTFTKSARLALWLTQ